MLVDSRKFAVHDQQSPKDRVALNNILAAYHANAAANMKGSFEQKSALMDKATMLYNQSDSIDVREPATWIGKGFLLILQGRLDQAFYQFKLSLDRDPNDVAALLGRACINCSRKQYRDALQDYQRALQLSPGFNPDIRFGIGLCWYKLQSLDRARKAFEQLIQTVGVVSVSVKSLFNSIVP
jgi:RNA polymerase-associated protein CTR9